MAERFVKCIEKFVKQKKQKTQKTRKNTYFEKQNSDYI
jgi:hypothetical protein